MIERLQHTERKRGRPYSAAGERKTDAIEHLAVDADAVFGTQRRAAERVAPLTDRVDFRADDVGELDLARTCARHGAVPSRTTEGSISAEFS